MSVTHNIERTSPKGEKFVGTCVLCGRTGLGMSDARDSGKASGGGGGDGR